MRKEIAAKDRALGGAHSWRGVGAGREGMREERGVAPPSPSFPVLPASAVPPCPEAKLVNGAEEPALAVKRQQRPVVEHLGSRSSQRWWDAQRPLSPTPSGCVTSGKTGLLGSTAAASPSPGSTAELLPRRLQLLAG